jgi:hypothetical protein
MKPHSSIFSFSTLQPGRFFKTVPKTLLVVLVILVAAEVAARWAVRADKLELDTTGRSVFEGYLAELKTRPSEVFLVGNSTLAEGVDRPLLEQLTGKKVAKMPIGSATVRAMTACLERYIAESPAKPQSVYVLVSPDDLNKNGYRATVSEQTIEVARGGWRKPQEHLYLYTTRGNILGAVESAFDKARGHKPPKPSTRPVVFDGKISDVEFNQNLAKKYEMDLASFDELAALAKAKGIGDVTVIIMPVTDVYQTFHDQQAPSPPYPQIRKSIADACAKNGLKVLDLGEPLKDYTLFKDPYHLNATGREWFTKMLAEKMK